MTAVASAQPAAIVGTRLIDWVSATVLDCTPERIMEWLGLEFRELTTSIKGYKKCFECEGVFVLADNHWDGCGVHVQVSGKGCRSLEAFGRVQDWAAWCGELLGLSERVNVTRLDVAIDDRSGLVTRERIVSSLEAGNVAKNAQCWAVTESHGSRQGWCVTVGSRASETYVRFYDKAAEQKVAGSWVRSEFEFKKDRAGAALRVFVAQGWDALIGVCRSAVEFKAPGQSDSNITRRKAASWWDSLMSASIHRLVPAVAAVETIRAKWSWLRKQVAVSLALVVEHSGGDVGEVYDLIDEGRRRYKPRHRAMLALCATS